VPGIEDAKTETDANMQAVLVAKAIFPIFIDFLLFCDKIINDAKK
jgi:hypothetical protein